MMIWSSGVLKDRIRVLCASTTQQGVSPVECISDRRFATPPELQKRLTVIVSPTPKYVSGCVTPCLEDPLRGRPFTLLYPNPTILSILYASTIDPQGSEQKSSAGKSTRKN